jgi:opacity protein-like surface antigen
MKRFPFLLSVPLLLGGSLVAEPVSDKMVVEPEPVCGPWYVSAYGGGSFFDSSTFSDGLNNTVVNLDNGWIAGGAVGLRTNGGMRFELDVNFAQSPADDSIPALGFPTANLGGEIERNSLMVNAVKEFGKGRIHPYAGAGIGFTHVQADLFSDFFGARFLAGEADETVLGYQFMGGFAFDVLDCLQAYAEYRLMGQGDLEDATIGIFGGTLNSADLGWGQHILLGVRWFF